MSEQSTRVTDAHYAYLAARTTQEDDFLKALRRAAIDADIPAIAISAEQASFMQILLRLCRAKVVVEVGTLAGYSAIAMARALPEDGRVKTIEIDARYANFAREWVKASDVPDRVEVVTGAGKEVLPRLVAESADACFLDADKSSYRDYLDEAMRILRPGGLVMVDNAFAFGQLFDEDPTDREVAGVKLFNDYIPTVAGLASVIVPLGDGLWVGVKD